MVVLLLVVFFRWANVGGKVEDWIDFGKERRVANERTKEHRSVHKSGHFNLVWDSLQNVSLSTELTNETFLRIDIVRQDVVWQRSVGMT